MRLQSLVSESGGVQRGAALVHARLALKLTQRFQRAFTTNSTRRFCARPSSVLLSAMGRRLP